ncbi:MAG: hypothetical protein AAGD38_19770 [Acidobacteriota bacterium]
MKNLLRILAVALVALAILGCEENVAEDSATSSGGVLLDMDWASGSTIPFRVSVNGNDNLRIPTITLSNIVADPNGSSSQLMDIQMDSLEIQFTRGDAGSRVPAPYVVRVLGTVPVGGTLTLENWDVMSFEQFTNPPLSDLMFENGGFDKETGSTIIRLNLLARAYGRTRGGDLVASELLAQSIEFSQ